MTHENECVADAEEAAKKLFTKQNFSDDISSTLLQRLEDSAKLYESVMSFRKKKYYALVVITVIESRSGGHIHCFYQHFIFSSKTTVFGPYSIVQTLLCFQ
ncbi:hypothetical protein BY458DRAFT_545495 [Sporodiniella umbellata]|nr:hypothetical protein BY458DRAFT_545495 [Sporodiniella umbellata]